jgi:hypothetical protein
MLHEGLAFSGTGVIVNYNTGSDSDPDTGGQPPGRPAMKTQRTHEQTMRMLTILAIACLTLASMMA